ncbi:NlpC/P60 family protein [Paenibacillus thalictri]|uniref:Peptidoglycan endopeptidase n=1 Tax=Paenibacillus thalictri TaxID=2527873 RepID=A0A4Q9DP25_9BACL|nr:NlpC/P60 family protein [Paenibacillus thalictri]TBL77846.1 peptidoglycan endopeptidase [Paenibacillus thalictri]
MSGQKKMLVAVSVAGVWTTPESPRALDEPALQNPVRLPKWLMSLTITDKLDLCDANRLQTQVLFGAEVIVTGESGDFAQVCVPDQKTAKSPLGYPGWVPKRQLAEPPSSYFSEGSSAAEWVEIVSPRAVLTLDGQPELELSFMTRLPYIGREADRVQVATPLGAGTLPAQDIRLASSCPSVDAQTGERIVDAARQFVGLPYLWSGMSSYGFDCSGFAHHMHKSQGILIPRDVSEQVLYGEDVSEDRLERGDLLFFARDEGKGKFHHVGIYIGDGCMIHSPDSRGAVEIVLLAEHKLAKEHSKSRRYWSGKPGAS